MHPAEPPSTARRRAPLRSALPLLLLVVLVACTSNGPGGSDGPGGGGPAGDGDPARWRPKAGQAWEWQLDGRIDTRRLLDDVPVYDIDGFENRATEVRALHEAGRRVICYVNVGAWESFRPDRHRYPRELLGKENGWPGERWLDIRRPDRLRPMLAARFDMCRRKGFDAVEPDLMDAYREDTGFPLTAAHQLAFNRMVAGLAHERGLAVGLKNDLPQIPQLVDDFDFAVNEQCAEYGECEALTPFVRAGKPVFHVEYEVANDDFCPTSRKLGLSSMRKRLDLDHWREPC